MTLLVCFFPFSVKKLHISRKLFCVNICMDSTESSWVKKAPGWDMTVYICLFHEPNIPHNHHLLSLSIWHICPLQSCQITRLQNYGWKVVNLEKVICSWQSTDSFLRWHTSANEFCVVITLQQITAAHAQHLNPWIFPMCEQLVIWK